MFRAWIHYFRVSKLRKWFRNEINHSTPLDPNRCFGVFRSFSKNFGTSNEAKTCVSRLNALFQGAEVVKMVSQQNKPFYPTWPQMTFETVSEHFANLRHVKRGKCCVSGLNALFRGTGVAKMVRNKINQSTPLDPKWCLRVFQSISQTFGTSNEEKLVFWSKTHYFGVPKLRKWFRNEIIHSIALDPKRSLRVFRSISQTSAHQTRQKLCPGPECTISGYRSCENGFVTKSSNLPN